MQVGVAAGGFALGVQVVGRQLHTEQRIVVGVKVEVALAGLGVGNQVKVTGFVVAGAVEGFHHRVGAQQAVGLPDRKGRFGAG